MIVRPLQRSDYDKGFLQLLSQLTSVGNITRKQYDGKQKYYHYVLHLEFNIHYVCNTQVKKKHV